MESSGCAPGTNTMLHGNCISFFKKIDRAICYIPTVLPWQLWKREAGPHPPPSPGEADLDGAQVSSQYLVHVWHK